MNNLNELSEVLFKQSKKRDRQLRKCQERNKELSDNLSLISDDLHRIADIVNDDDLNKLALRVHVLVVNNISALESAKPKEMNEQDPQ